jgi:hypothetical protein
MEEQILVSLNSRSIHVVTTHPRLTPGGIRSHDSPEANLERDTQSRPS